MEISALAKRVFLDESFVTRGIVRMIAHPGPVAMLLMVRDEADIIEANINFHLHFGIERFVVTDNGSKDGTRDILADFARQLPDFVIIDDPRAAFDQGAMVNRMIAVAKRRLGPRWIIPSDADEFWFPISGRYDTELDGRKNVLECSWHNYLPRPGGHWTEFTEIGNMVGYTGSLSKAFCLARGLRGMYDGNHVSRSIPRVVAKSTNIRVYHYPVRSYSQFERKVVQGYRAVTKFAARDSGVAWHWERAYRAWEEGRLQELYFEYAKSEAAFPDNTMPHLFRQLALHGSSASCPRKEGIPSAHSSDPR